MSLETNTVPIARAEAAEARVRDLETILRRIGRSGVLSGVADGSYWLEEIRRVLAQSREAT